MNRLLMFSIYDSACEAFMPPFVQRAKGEAVRTFAHMAKNPESFISKRPDQFTLFLIGEFDETSCFIEVYEAKESLGTALEWMEAKEPPVRVVRNA